MDNMTDELPHFGTEEKVSEVKVLGETEVYRPRPKKIRKRARPFDDNIEEQAKKIKVEPTGSPTPPVASRELDSEGLKRKVFSIQQQYDNITYGLKIVRDHMGRMMERIRELDGLLYTSEKQCLLFATYLRFS